MCRFIKECPSRCNICNRIDDEDVILNVCIQHFFEIIDRLKDDLERSNKVIDIIHRINIKEVENV